MIDFKLLEAAGLRKDYSASYSLYESKEFLTEIQHNVVEPILRFDRLLLEAELSQDQITKLFADVEAAVKDSDSKGKAGARKVDTTGMTPDEARAATEKGDKSELRNRTLIGAGADVFAKIKEIVEGEKWGFVKDFDRKIEMSQAKYRELAKDSKTRALILDAVDKYAALAKKYPAVQTVVWSILVVLTGVLTGGASAAVIIGILKFIERMIMGERFSSAVIKGMFVGGMTFLIQNLKEMIRNGFDTPAKCPPEVAKNCQANAKKLCTELPKVDPGTCTLITPPPETVVGNGATFGEAFAYARKTLGPNEVFTWNGGTYHTNLYVAGKTPAQLVGPVLGKVSYTDLAKAAAKSWDSVDLGKIPAAQLKNIKAVELFASLHVEGNMLVESLITEGWFSNLLAKTQAALANVGNNLTNKITANKLHKAWINANKPVETKQMRDFLVTHLSKVYGAEYNDTVVRIIDGLMKNITSSAPEEVPGSTEGATPGEAKGEMSTDDARADGAAGGKAAGAGRGEAANDETGGGREIGAGRGEAANDDKATGDDTPKLGAPKDAPKLTGPGETSKLAGPKGKEGGAVTAAANDAKEGDHLQGANASQHLQAIKSMPEISAKAIVDFVSHIWTDNDTAIRSWLNKQTNKTALKGFLANAIALSKHGAAYMEKMKNGEAETTGEEEPKAKEGEYIPAPKKISTNKKTLALAAPAANESMTEKQAVDRVLFEIKTFKTAGIPAKNSKLFKTLKEMANIRLNQK